MAYLLVHPTRKTVHEPNCHWLAGTKLNLQLYDERDPADPPRDAKACSCCAPTISRRDE